MKIKITFCECEHHGDLDNYEDAVRQAGGQVLSSDVDTDDEVGTVIAEVQDTKAFLDAIKKTEGGEFAIGFSKV